MASTAVPPPPATPGTANRTASTTSIGSAYSLDTPGRSAIGSPAARGAGGGGDSVLSQKVTRALEVRSDTPAMLAALDALADLPSYRRGDAAENTPSAVGEGATSAGGATAVDGGLSSGTIDPRTVRQAIEVDALQQAKLLQSELSTLVATVASLRGQIVDVADAAKMVGREMRRDVVGISLEGGHGSGHGGHGSGHHLGGHHGREEKHDDATAEGPADPITAALRGSSSSSNTIDPTADLPSNLTISPAIYGTDALAAERRLASLLHSAFANRHEAKVRAETVRKFMDRFDLSERDERLLVGYEFEEFGNGGGGGGGGGKEDNTGDGDDDGMAFLDALERVRKIRGELVRTFHLDSDTTVGGSSSSDALTSTTTNASSSSLGITSALRMMESLSAKQEKAYERLYHFLTSYLDLHTRSVSNVPTRSGGGHHGGGMQQPPPHQHQSATSASAQRLEEDAMDATLRHPFVVRSLQVLRHKPSYHAHTLELIAASRRALVTRKFLLALTSGYDGLPPIEMSAHDPVHYVGDMLAFVFRVESEEADLAGGLAGGGDEAGDDGGDEGGGDDDTAAGAQEDGAADDADNDDGIDNRPMSSAAVLSHATSGISRPLKSRVFQVIASLARHPSNVAGEEGGPSAATADGDDIGGHGPDGTFTAHDLDEEAGSARTHLSQLYEICGLLLYYRSAFHKTVARLVKGSGGGSAAAGTALDENDDDQDDENALIKCLQECLDEAATAFGASLRVYAATLPNIASLSNESESSLVQGTVAKICEVRMGSPGFFAAEDPSAAGHINLDKLPTLSIEFLVDTAVDAAMSHCARLDDAVALRNAVVTAKKAGLESAVATKWDQAISGKERSLADSLIDGETRHVVETVGLAPVADALTNMEAVFVEGQLISSHPGLGPNDVQAVMKDFYDSLYSPPTPAFDMIRDPVLRKYARTKTAQKVVELYAKIYDTLRSERGGYDDLSFLSMAPEQVKTLLSV